MKEERIVLKGWSLVEWAGPGGIDIPVEGESLEREGVLEGSV